MATFSKKPSIQSTSRSIFQLRVIALCKMIRKLGIYSSIPIRHVEMDLCFDYDDFPEVMKVIQKYYKKNKKRMVNPVVGKILKIDLDIRCSKAEPFYLSGAYGKKVFWVDFIALRYGARYNNKYHKQLHALLSPFKFKRHWGKMSYLSRQEISERYGEGLVKFCEIRKQMDPEGIFKNYYLDCLIGDPHNEIAGDRPIMKKGQVANYNDSDEEVSEAIEEEGEDESDDDEVEVEGDEMV
jgi:hypothetical protein